MTENRIEPTTPATAATDKQLAPISPTGTPIIPPQYTPWAVALVAIAAVVPLLPGVPPLVIAICGAVVALGAALGIASPGMRRQQR